jgi:exodeoxyribonuclease-3
MRIVSWNVNGFRSCISKGLFDFIKSSDADIVCLQEIKTHDTNNRLEISQYYQYWNPAQRNGYSGTAVFSKNQANLLDIEFFDDEGRIIALDYNDFYLINCYSPQVRRDLSRLEYRIDFDEKMQAFLNKLNVNKPVILCGDLNVAHNEIDLKNPKSNTGHAGFTNEERESFAKLIDSGFIDSFRNLYPDKEGAYTWWSYRKGVRERNVGWRIDYVLTSEILKERITESKIYDKILGSDHCPIGIDIKI